MSHSSRAAYSAIPGGFVTRLARHIFAAGLFCAGTVGIAHAQGVRCPDGTIPYAPLQTQNTHGQKQDTLCIDALSGAVTGTSVWLAGAGAGAPAAATYVTVDNTGPAPTNYQVLTAGANITLTPNAAAHTMTVAATGSGGSSSGPTNSVQVSNGSGGFNSASNTLLTPSNGWLSINQSGAAAGAPLDFEWTSISKAVGPDAMYTIGATFTSTSASPPDVHLTGGLMTLQGTDAAFSDGTDAFYYATLRDNRTPSGASTVGHELVTVSRLGFNGGANLTCTSCAAYYATADFGGADSSSHIGGISIDGGQINGTGTLNGWVGVSSGNPTVTSGGVHNITMISAGMAGTYSHGTDTTGCGAGVAIGSGVCTKDAAGNNQFALFSDAAFPSAIGGTFAIGQQAAAATGLNSILQINGGVEIGSTGGSHSDISLTSLNNGSPAITIKMPTGQTGIVQKWPDVSGTYVATNTQYDNAAVTGSLGNQTLFSANLFNHFFRVTFYATCSAAVAASTVVFNVSYKDDVQSQTASSPSFSCAASGTFSSWSTSFYTDTLTNVIASTTGTNAPQYKIHIVIEAINTSNNST